MSTQVAAGEVAMTSAQQGYASLSNEDLLRKLIGARESRRLYRGALQPLFAATEESPVSEKCAVARELVLRSLREELASGRTMRSPRVVRDYLSILLKDRDYEVFVVMFLDAQHRVIAAEEMFRGTLTQTSVYPREVVKTALRLNSAAVIFAHNHPSGVPEPSRADEALTKALKQALALVDVKVLDHMIVAGAEILSFAEKGLL